MRSKSSSRCNSQGWELSLCFSVYVLVQPSIAINSADSRDNYLHLGHIDSYPVNISLSSAMITRSAKAAHVGRSSPLDGPSSSSTRKNRAFTDIDLEEERAIPTKDDYNDVRKALIKTRSISESRTIALENAKAELAQKDLELKKCSKTHADRIQELEETLKDYQRKEEERRNRERSTEPESGEEVSTEDEEPTTVGDAMLRSLRSAIHEFATKYFGNKLQKRLAAVPGAGWAAQFMESTTPGEKTYKIYLQSRWRCPMIVEAFIWRFLCGTIFNAAAWSGSEEIRSHVGGLQKIFSECR